ncbi:hypothetical protein [Rubrivirga marina]|uniref:Uncharacterized protein n=1 Tax=Rubrivirga marina TaxID=1196024 RepID=A0A271J240_9BACT|nr:hypothetical protein [Rubrivirga marina]PAP77562.1 hypothetical protein BSZ37_14480 [Rubrivirga marina]
MASDDTRPDQIEGISTETGDTPGDPELRTVNAAPDLSDDSPDSDAEVADDVNDVPGDETPGTALNPH